MSFLLVPSAFLSASLFVAAPRGSINSEIANCQRPEHDVSGGTWAKCRRMSNSKNWICPIV